MDVDTEDAVVTLTRRLEIVEAKLDSANHIIGLVMDALKNPANKDLITKVTRLLMRDRLGFLF